MTAKRLTLKVPPMSHLLLGIAKVEEVQPGVSSAWKPKKHFRGRALTLYQIAVLKTLGLWGNPHKTCRYEVMATYLGSKDNLETFLESGVIEVNRTGKIRLQAAGHKYLDSFLTGNPVLSPKFNLCVDRMVEAMKTGKFGGEGCSPFFPPNLTFVKLSINS